MLRTTKFDDWTIDRRVCVLGARIGLVMELRLDIGTGCDTLNELDDAAAPLLLHSSSSFINTLYLLLKGTSNGDGSSSATVFEALRPCLPDCLPDCDGDVARAAPKSISIASLEVVFANGRFGSIFVFGAAVGG